MADRTVAIVQARLGSTRLPGKVLEPISGRPMIEWVVARTRSATLLDDVVVAIPDLPADDPLDEALRGIVRVVRGPAEDVLARFEAASRSADASALVRITADCPLIDPVVIDRVVDAMRRERADYASNTLSRTYPRGLDAEAFTREALDEANATAKETFEREHVTPYIYRHPQRFVLASVVAEVDRHEMRWTVDEPADLALVRLIYEGLGDAISSSRLEDILSLLAQHPEWQRLNSGVRQKGLDE